MKKFILLHLESGQTAIFNTEFIKLIKNVNGRNLMKIKTPRTVDETTYIQENVDKVNFLMDIQGQSQLINPFISLNAFAAQNEQQHVLVNVNEIVCIKPIGDANNKDTLITFQAFNGVQVIDTTHVRDSVNKIYNMIVQNTEASNNVEALETKK